MKVRCAADAADGRSSRARDADRLRTTASWPPSSQPCSADRIGQQRVVSGSPPGDQFKVGVGATLETTRTTSLTATAVDCGPMRWSMQVHPARHR